MTTGAATPRPGRRRRAAPPRLRVVGADAERSRHASWLELFFDLVFVVAIAELAAVLHDDPNVGGVLAFAALNVTLIWTWMNFTFYADQFESDDAVFRVAMFLAMAAVLVMAVALDPPGAVFVAAYVAIKLLLVWLYLRPLAGDLDATARAFCRWCAVAYGSSAVLWALSLLLPEPYRYGLWAVGLAVEILFPAVGPSAFEQMPLHLEHIPERFGLFTIIVFGETLVITALGLESDDLSVAAGVTAGLGFALACALWWLYFDRQEETALRPTIRPNLVFIYGHIPLLVGLNAATVGVEFAIEHASSHPLHLDERLIAMGGLAVALLALTAIQGATRAGLTRVAIRARCGVAAALVVAGLLSLAAVPLLALALVLVLGLVLVGGRREAVA